MNKQMQNGMDKNTLKDMDQSTKLNVMIDYIYAIDKRTKTMEENREIARAERKEHCQIQYDSCDKRFKRIEKLYYGVIAVLLVANVVVPPTLLTIWS